MKSPEPLVSESLPQKLFECKICLETPVDAIATRCGHVYCWGCLCQWARTNFSGKIPCPFCHSQVDINNVIPLYTSVEKHNKRKITIPRKDAENGNPFRLDINALGLNFFVRENDGGIGRNYRRRINLQGCFLLVPMLMVIFLPYVFDQVILVIDCCLSGLSFFNRSPISNFVLQFLHNIGAKTKVGITQAGKYQLEVAYSLAVVLIVGVLTVHYYERQRHRVLRTH